MDVLVAYASRHGATAGIAERLGEKLGATVVDLRGDQSLPDPAAYDAVIVGSATYMFSWLGEATRFVRDHADVLSQKPVWLFSSGPLGAEETDEERHDVPDSAEPREMAELVGLVKPRGHRVFFGALDPDTLGVRDRLIRNLMPGGRKLMEEGDFRDWAEIDAWAEEIARELAPVTAGTA